MEGHWSLRLVSQPMGDELQHPADAGQQPRRPKTALRSKLNLVWPPSFDFAVWNIPLSDFPGCRKDSAQLAFGFRLGSAGPITLPAASDPRVAMMPYA